MTARKPTYPDKRLRAVTAADWAKRIRKLDGAVVRNGVASIIWFDYLSHQSGDKNRALFEPYLLGFKWEIGDASYADVVAGLINVGYDAKRATERAKPAAYWQNENDRRNVDRSHHKKEVAI